MSWAADAYATQSSDLGELKWTIKNLLDQRREKGLTQTQISKRMDKRR
jgi:hypothetical protein